MLTFEEVKHVATLARMDLTNEEITTFQEDLSKVLIFFKELEALNTDQERDIGHITGRVNEARPDQVQEEEKGVQEYIRKNFPESEEGFLKVRSVL